MALGAQPGVLPRIGDRSPEEKDSFGVLRVVPQEVRPDQERPEAAGALRHREGHVVEGVPEGIRVPQREDLALVRALVPGEELGGRPPLLPGHEVEEALPDRLGAVAAAVELGEGPVGLDVERPGPVDEGPADRLKELHPALAGRMEDPDPDRVRRPAPAPSSRTPAGSSAVAGRSRGRSGGDRRSPRPASSR